MFVDRNDAAQRLAKALAKFCAVGQSFRSFPQFDDETVIATLAESHRAAGEHRA